MSQTSQLTRAIKYPLLVLSVEVTQIFVSLIRVAKEEWDGSILRRGSTFNLRLMSKLPSSMISFLYTTTSALIIYIIFPTCREHRNIVQLYYQCPYLAHKTFYRIQNMSFFANVGKIV